jgi:hypothetical protein
MVYGDSLVGTVGLEAGTVVRVGKPANRGGLALHGAAAGGGPDRAAAEAVR